MITEVQAQQFSTNWLAAWNAHDIERGLSHYDDNIEYYSTFSTKLTDNKESVIYGKVNLTEYFVKGFQLYPQLHFKLERVFLGIASITLQYKSVSNLLAAEVFELNTQGLAFRVQCHYTQQ